MLQSLLRDRFALTLHSGTKDFELYTLTVGEKKAPAKPEDLSSYSLTNIAACTGMLKMAMGRPVLNQTGIEEPYPCRSNSWSL